jgi:cell division protein FtsI/penicillin-binding protein 2
MTEQNLSGRNLSGQIIVGQVVTGDERGRGAKPWVIGGVVAALVAAGGGIPAWNVLQGRRDRADLEAAVARYAGAWQSGTFTEVPFTGTDAATVTTRMAAITKGLAATPIHPAVRMTGVPEAKDGATQASLHVTWPLGQGRSWAYDTVVPVSRAADRWSIGWTPQTVHPKLTEGNVLSAVRTTAARGDIVGAGGTVLVTSRPVVHVGIEPARMKQAGQTVAAVAALVDVDAAALTKRLAAAKPHDFVDVITLRRDDYEKVKAQLQPIPGTVFQTATTSLAPSPVFARALLGSVGPATKEIVDTSKGRVRAGDTAGLSGVQRAYDEQLAGVAGLRVQAVAEQGATAQPLVLFTVAPVAGQAVTLTLDEKVQLAADAALAKATKPAALVAIRPSTGEVLAIANGGPNATGYDRALIGQYPPGSTFKVVTSYALLQKAFTSQTAVPCPKSITVSGKVFTNAENEVLGTGPFATAFAQSCNTAFVGSAAKITGTDLTAAATALGYGAPNTLGLAGVFNGSVPPTDNPVEHAADAIGQGKVLASPLTVAGVSAAVAAGKRMPLSLVVTTTPVADPAATPSASAVAVPAPVPLDPTAVAALQSLMRGVVTGGTGTALKSVPGGPVHDKTGTAEYGGGTPPPTHAWFTGYQGDVAFAVVVEGGGFGAKAAAPLAAAFLTSLA